MISKPPAQTEFSNNPATYTPTVHCPLSTVQEKEKEKTSVDTREGTGLPKLLYIFSRKERKHISMSRVGGCRCRCRCVGVWVCGVG